MPTPWAFANIGAVYGELLNNQFAISIFQNWIEMVNARGNSQEAYMAEAWQFQVRITVSPELADALRAREAYEGRDLLEAVLDGRDATLKCQFDAFADYVEEAERAGRDRYPLYSWTKDTIANPEKKAKYLKSFTVYVRGDEVYDRETADWLHAQLSALAGKVGIESVTRFDTNPANNPQPPARK
jgi:hypothetical protein